MANNLNNQTQFNLEGPLLDGQMGLPKTEEPMVSPVLKPRGLIYRHRLLVLGGVGAALFIIGVYMLLTVSMRFDAPVKQRTAPTPTPSPTKQKMSLKEQIDELAHKIELFEKPSQSLVFPPVETQIRVKQPR